MAICKECGYIDNSIALFKKGKNSDGKDRIWISSFTGNLLTKCPKYGGAWMNLAQESE